MKRPVIVTTITLIVGVAFWLGVLSEAMKKQPDVTVTRISIPAQPATLIQRCDRHAYEEVDRICRLRKRSTQL